MQGNGRQVMQASSLQCRGPLPNNEQVTVQRDDGLEPGWLWHQGHVHPHSIVAGGLIGSEVSGDNQQLGSHRLVSFIHRQPDLDVTAHRDARQEGVCDGGACAHVVGQHVSSSWRHSHLAALPSLPRFERPPLAANRRRQAPCQQTDVPLLAALVQQGAGDHDKVHRHSVFLSAAARHHPEKHVDHMLCHCWLQLRQGRARPWPRPPQVHGSQRGHGCPRPTLTRGFQARQGAHPQRQAVQDQAVHSPHPQAVGFGLLQEGDALQPRVDAAAGLQDLERRDQHHAQRVVAGRPV
ncbi:hypothetical protein V8C86DRAFT_2700880 [Haematococcus lacustris]